MTVVDPTDDVTLLRMVLQDTGPVPILTDGMLLRLLDLSMSMQHAAAIGWKIKAASLANLVDVTESGAERKLSQMFKNATAMIKVWDAEAAGIEDSVASSFRVAGIGASPYCGILNQFTYIIGDASRGPSGMITFIEIPVPYELSGYPAPSNVLTLIAGEEYNVSVVQGVTWTLTFKFQMPGGTPDISGWTAGLYLDPDNTDVALITQGSGITLHADGTIDLVLSATQTGAVALGEHTYRMLLVNGGTTYLVMSGMLTSTLI